MAVLIKSIDELESHVKGKEGETIVWNLCHYPDHVETDERIKKAAEIYQAVGVPVWLFGSFSARYGKPVDELTAEKLVALGVPREKVRCSKDFSEEIVTLDTVQEMINILKVAREQGVKQIICVSNPLQLLQIYGFLKREDIEVLYVPTTLRDWRWWYVSVRVALIPLAFANVGKEKFLPLKFVRYARSAWAKWPL